MRAVRYITPLSSARPSTDLLEAHAHRLSMIHEGQMLHVRKCHAAEEVFTRRHVGPACDEIAMPCAVGGASNRGEAARRREPWGALQVDVLHDEAGWLAGVG